MVKSRPLFWEAIRFADPASRAHAEYWHKKRSRRARTIDELHNAPITLGVEEWKRKPNRLDFPGVDTIPYHRRLGQAKLMYQKMKAKGFIRKAVVKRLPSGIAGSFYGKTKMVAVTPEIRDQDLALGHEMGHGLHRGLGYVSPKSSPFKIFGAQSREVQKQATLLAKRVYKFAPEKYLGIPKESFASAFGSFVVQPRATKREVPMFAKKIEEILQG